MHSTTPGRTWPRLPSRIALLLFGVTLLVGVGCGKKDEGPKNFVAGKVTLNGEPVAGMVVFTGPGNKEVSSPINIDGSYRVADPAVGQNTIVVKSAPGMSMAPAGSPPKDAPPLTGASGSAKMGVAPPAKYASPGNGLKYDVKGGKETHDIKLEP